MRRIHLERLSCAAAIVLTLGACAGTSDDGSSVGPVGPDEQVNVTDDAGSTDEAGPTDEARPTIEATPTEEPGPTAPDQGSAPPPEDPVPPADDAIDVRAHGPELLWRTGSRAEVIALLAPEGESTFVAAAVRPGSTVDDATIVTLTMAEGFYDLRSLTYRDEVASELAVFPEPYRPDQDMLADGGVAPIPVWSPDGASLAWLEWGPDGDVQLRTIGWRGDAPGTGRPADDNAAFAVDLPSEVWLEGWRDHGDATRLLVASHEGREWTITLLRQADGAWAMEPDAVVAG